MDSSPKLDSLEEYLDYEARKQLTETGACGIIGHLASDYIPNPRHCLSSLHYLSFYYKPVAVGELSLPAHDSFCDLMIIFTDPTLEIIDDMVLTRQGRDTAGRDYHRQVRYVMRDYKGIEETNMDNRGRHHVKD